MTVRSLGSSIAIEEPRFLAWPAGILLGLLLALFAAPMLVSVVMLGLAVYAWRGAKESIQALTVMFLVLNLNAGLFPFWGQGASLRWLVLFSAFGRVLWDGVLSDAKWPFDASVAITLFALVVGFLGYLASSLPVVSIFKIVAFYIGAVTILTCFYRTRAQKSYWLSWFYTLSVVVLFVSLPFYFTATGFYVNGRGFQGILNHPQTFGPVLAPLTAGLTIWTLLSRTRSYGIGVVIGLGLLCMILSQSRTALLMYTLSILVAFGLHLWRGERLKIWKSRPMMSAGFKLIVFVSACLAMVLSGDKVVEASEGFLLKKSANQESLSFQVRTSMLNQQMDNFRENPLTGIGFGVPSSNDNWTSLTTGFLGMPTGFPVEKGFLPSAVLEETGLIGAVLLLVLFYTLIGRVLRSRSLFAITIVIASLLANVGEMVFFSFGGAGLYFWLLIGYCYNHVIPCVE